MEDWKIDIGAKVTECSLKGPSGKEKKVRITFANGTNKKKQALADSIKMYFFPLENGQFNGYGWNKLYGDQFYVLVTTHDGAVELRDKILAVMDEYENYINASDQTDETEADAGDDSGTSGQDDDGDKPSTVIVLLILAAVALALYELL